MPAKYYYGLSVLNAKVEASTARHFRELIQKHVEPAMRLHVTQQEYVALTTRKEKLAAKDSPYLVACVFKTTPSQRNRENAEDCCNLLFLDMDEEADGKCPARPFVRNPDSLTKALAGYNFAAFTTASSTKEKPRMRVMVEAENIPLDSYPDAVNTIAKIIGIADVTKESLIPNQPMILPSLFADQDPDFDHPMVCSNLKGKAFTIEDIRVSDHSTSTKDDKVSYRAAQSPSDGDDGLEYLRAPLEGATLESISEALNIISPDIAYPEWFDMAAALRHQFSTSEDEAEAAYSLFDKWSSKGAKYVDSDDTLAKWLSVKPTPVGRIPVTIRTLIKRAADAGWSAGKLKEECFSKVLNYIQHEAKTLHDLTRTALERIAALPMLTSVEEEMLLTAIRTQLKEARGELVTVLSLRKDLKHIRDIKERSKDGASAAEEPAWAKGWCYITSEEMFFRPSSHQTLSTEALNCAFSRHLLPTKEQLEQMGRETNDSELSKPLFLPAQYLLNHQQCLVVADRNYDPTSPKEIYTETPDGVRYVNTYRRSYPKADRTQAEAAGKMILKHFENLIAEPEYRRVVLDYIAHCVQFPGKKIRWAILIQGAEGCGKSFLAKVIGTILGEDNVKFLSNDAIRSQWSDWTIGTQVNVIGEIRVAGHNRHDIMNRLKEAVTDDRISVTQRNRSVRTERNLTNYVMFTNYQDALALMHGSRRYFIVKSALQTEEQVLALGPEYFNELFEAIAQNAAGLRAFFEDWVISDDFPADGRAPKTIYLEEMIEDSANDLVGAIRRLIREGESPLIADDMIYSGILESALELEGLRESPQVVARMLREENFVRLAGRGIEINGMRKALWVKSGKFAGLSDAQIFEIARQRANGEEPTQPEEEWI
jgi:hypothetical protein